MASTRAKKRIVIILAAIVVLIGGAIVGFQAAVGLLKGRIIEALGPDSEVKELRVRWSAVELNGLRIKARQGWPAADTLRAERVVIVPSLLAGAASEGKAAAGPPVRSLTISRIRLEDGVVELFDATVAQPPLKIRLDWTRSWARPARPWSAS